MRLKTVVVILSAKACEIVDSVVYQPSIVRLLRRSPVVWTCQLARLSYKLDDHWSVRWWGSDGRPKGICQACERRAAWLEIGGWALDDEIFDVDSDDYLAYQRRERLWLLSSFEQHDYDSRRVAQRTAPSRSAVNGSLMPNLSVMRLKRFIRSDSSSG